MKKNIHPAWLQTLLIFLVMFSIYGVVYNTTSLFIEPISQDLGISLTQTNFIITIKSIGSIITLWSSSYFFKRFGVKKMMFVGLIGTILTLLLFSYAKNLTTMYLAYFLLGISVTYISELSCSMIINFWFDEKASLANGIASTGSGLGGAVASTGAGFLIANFGWRLAYRSFAIIGFAIAIIPVLLLKVYPSDCGCRPYGNKDNSKPMSHTGIEYKKIRKNPLFWLLLITINLISYSYYIIIVGFPAHLLNIGYSIELTGTISAIMLLAMSGMKIGLGYIYDEWDIARAVLFTCIVLIIGIISAVNAHKYIFLGLAIFCFATGSANFAQSLQGVTRKLFGRKDYGIILRVFMIGNYGGGIVCPIISGLAFDKFGSYIPLYKTVLIPAIILLVLNQILIKNIKNKVTSTFAEV